MIPTTTVETPPNFATLIRTLRIIVLALAFGVTAFAVVAISIGKAPAPPAKGQAAPAGDNLLLSTLLPIVATLSGLSMAFIVPPLITAAKVKQLAQGPADTSSAGLAQADDGSQLMLAYHSTSVVRCALIEGPAFLNLFLYMSQHSVIALVLVGVLWLALLAQFPRTDAVLAWLERQMKRLADERSLLPSGGPIDR